MKNAFTFLESRKTCPACRLLKCKTVGMVERDVQLNRDANGPLKIPRQTDIQTKNRPISSQNTIPLHNLPSTSCGSSSSPLEQQNFYAQSNVSLLNRLQSYVQEYFRNEKALYMMLHPDRACEENVVVVSKLFVEFFNIIGNRNF